MGVRDQLPLGPRSPRISPSSYGTALELAEVEGLTRSNASRRQWYAPGSEFLSWRAGTQDWLGAQFCSFWWD